MVQCDLRVVDVDRCHLHHVMDDHTRLVYPTGQTVLTQIPLLLRVFIPAVLPVLGTVELLCKLSGHGNPLSVEARHADPYGADIRVMPRKERYHML